MIKGKSSITYSRALTEEENIQRIASFEPRGENDFINLTKNSTVKQTDSTFFNTPTP